MALTLTCSGKFWTVPTKMFVAFQESRTVVEELGKNNEILAKETELLKRRVDQLE